MSAQVKTDTTSFCNQEWSKHCQFFEYGSAANPRMPHIGVDVFPPAMHQIKETKLIPLQLAHQLETTYSATGPNLLANYIHIAAGEKITTSTHASSQVFYCIRGAGFSMIQGSKLEWKTGDFFALPLSADITHHASEDTAFYWVNDQPLMDFLGARPTQPRFRPLYFSHAQLTSELEKVRKENEGKDKNRNGILLANPDCPKTKTLTHSMWSLYNLLPAKTRQKAHRHNSIAMDFAVKASPGVYTMIGPKLDADGNIINPIRADWVAGGSFVTPPGWWHSHHNESDQDAIVLPVQDAGLQTYMQTLDIQFSHGY
jgi:gentisate 1,2-dioxygenase